jgi:hypothetical protein
VIRLRVREDVRAGDVPPGEADLLAWLGGPSVLRVAGRDRTRARAVGALLHGNEPSGLRAVHALLRAPEPPAVDVVCFVGAVAAARTEPAFSHRMLPGRRDLNRCFRRPWDDEDGAVAREALAYLEAARPEAVVDLHNNTGHNPAYAISPHPGPLHLALASVFVSRFIHSALRIGSLMEAFAAETPAVTIECGRAGTSAADAFACERLARFAAMDRPPAAAPRMHVFVDPMRVTLRQGATVAFAATAQAGSDLTMAGEVDRHNFTLLPPGAHIGWIAHGAPLPVEVRDACGHDVTRSLFEARDGALVTLRPIIPIMMTTNSVVAAADCLFYVVRDAS